MSEANQDDKPTIFKNKKLMAGAGGGVLAFTSVVFAYIDGKIDDVNKRIDDKYAHVKEYVDTKHTNVDEKLIKIENILVRIDDRVYELTKTKKEF